MSLIIETTVTEFAADKTLEPDVDVFVQKQARLLILNQFFYEHPKRYDEDPSSTAYAKKIKIRFRLPIFCMLKSNVLRKSFFS